MQANIDSTQTKAILDKLEGYDLINTVQPTNEKVKVTPGVTVVDGTIKMHMTTMVSSMKVDIVININIDEEEYSINKLYNRLSKEMTESQANYINNVIDYALAV